MYLMNLRKAWYQRDARLGCECSRTLPGKSTDCRGQPARKLMIRQSIIDFFVPKKAYDVRMEDDRHHLWLSLLAFAVEHIKCIGLGGHHVSEAEQTSQIGFLPSGPESLRAPQILRRER